MHIFYIININYMTMNHNKPIHNIPFSLYLVLDGHLYKWKNPMVTRVDWMTTAKSHTIILQLCVYLEQVPAERL